MQICASGQFCFWHLLVLAVESRHRLNRQRHEPVRGVKDLWDDILAALFVSRSSREEHHRDIELCRVLSYCDLHSDRDEQQDRNQCNMQNASGNPV
jgi:hypothetical protein